MPIPAYNCTNPFYAQCRNASIPGGLNCRNGAHCYPCGLNTTGTDIDLCNDEERGRGFRCICPLGFAPPFCDAPYTACTEHQCQNGATCVLVNSTANSTVDDDDVGYRYGSVACAFLPLSLGAIVHRFTTVPFARTNRTLARSTVTSFSPIYVHCLNLANYCVNGQCVLDRDWHQGFRCDCAQGFTGFRCDLAVKAGFIVSFQVRTEQTTERNLFICSNLVRRIRFSGALRVDVSAGNDASAHPVCRGRCGVQRSHVSSHAEAGSAHYRRGRSTRSCEGSAM